MIVPALNERASKQLVALHTSFAVQLRDETADTLTRERFAELLAAAIDLFHVQPVEIHKAFDVTPATISRWRNQESYPGAYIRTNLMKWLADVIEAMIKEEPARRGKPVQARPR